jgi:microcystin-dependent protein
MAGIKQLRSWFFAVTSDATRLRNSDKPPQQTFENLLTSVAFLTESSDKAKVSTGATLSAEQGLSVLANDTQAKANAAQLADRSLVTQPHQLPTVNAGNNDMTVGTIPSDGSVTSSQVLFDISPDVTTTRNNFIVRLTTAGSKWLLRRILPSGGIQSSIIIKNTTTDYDYSWDTLDSGSIAMNSLITQLTNSTQFTTSVQNTFTTIINSNPVYFSDLTPIGYIQLYSSTTAPSSKWLRCDGASLSTTTYADLFALLGYSFGGAGANFNLPDFRDRQPTGYSGTKALATTGGAESHTISTSNLPPHIHELGGATGTTNTTGAHTHTGSTIANNLPVITAKTPGPEVAVGGLNVGSISADGDHSHTVTLNAGNTGNGGFANTALDTKDPYLAINFIIKVLK